MILITSAAYIRPGLASEFGNLPPCMLPVQNKRLYEHQVKLFPGQKIYLSLPSTYQLSNRDRELLKYLGVELLFPPVDLSLGQSVVYCLNCIEHYNEPVAILHGDTLFASLDVKEDSYVVSKAEDNYSWDSSDRTSTVFAGFFSFSKQRDLICKIAEHKYDFIDGVRSYSQLHPMQEIESDMWLDFGITNSYYKSISKLTTQRVFNTLEATTYSIRKSSKDKLKMCAEAQWFASLPKSLKHYAPAIYDCGADNDRGYYEMEYLYLSSLSSLFVFGEIPIFVWRQILLAAKIFLEDEYKYKPVDIKGIASQIDSLYLPKTLKRLSDFHIQSGLDLCRSWKINGETVPGLTQIAEEVDKYISKTDSRFVSVAHGDFCFSNILYDYKSNTVKVLDPRGMDLYGNLSIYGDIRYDIAKLAHSIIGKYDFIIGGRYGLYENGPYDIEFSFDTNTRVEGIITEFLNLRICGYSFSELSTYPIMIHLFLSMLPLHYDKPERQKAMLANALRLYVEFKKTL